MQNIPPSELFQSKPVFFFPRSPAVEVHLLTRTIQGTNSNESGTSSDYDQSWICAIANLPSLQRRHVAIARLRHPSNMGSTCHEVRLFVLVLCPSKETGLRNLRKKKQGEKMKNSLEEVLLSAGNP
ncbi:unnamed protein product [Cyprideis torosa]|uniref:Uncharacterized protein n=1 Tax=Cyprideis torosa TaxID=163714 RepID=A0A7R8W0J0_9CRUS|nr:unnamed protein product [Cyprideis torosa]CAG0879811.1 unnamed protein product [Cyprideis torosa]